MLLDSPSPDTDCHTFLDTLPLERDVLYGRPLRPGHILCGLDFRDSLRLLTNDAIDRKLFGSSQFAPNYRRSSKNGKRSLVLARISLAFMRVT